MFSTALSILCITSLSTASPLLRRDSSCNDFSIHLISGPLSPGSPSALELSASRRALNAFKDHLGPSAITSLLATDISSSDATWHAILANSTPPTTPILSEARLVAYNTAYNASSFLAWFGADTGDPHKMTGAHPEHYAESMAVDPRTGIPSVDILEAWGPLITRYRIPEYQLGGPKKPWMKELAEFPFQFTGEATLRDGSGAVVGDIHNSFRDLGRGEVGQGRRGVEAVLAVWMPGGTPEGVVEGLREHQAVEFTNWLGFAQRDFEEGRFVV